ncbi:hypothetical protein [Vampirovibrio sp.]|uniref:hypothetical protein n=1 Tax=Vampirovibrio sp. TaxID=2717857 RepID=UPI0035932B33
MSDSLLFLRRPAAACLVVASLFTAPGLVGFSHAEPVSLDAAGAETETITLNADEKLLAHHEGSSAGVGQLLHDDENSQDEVTDSLWGNLLLSMAYRRDESLKGLVKKMGVSNNLFLASIAGVSGLGLAQSITGLATLNQHKAGGAHHEEGEHVGGGGGHRESLAPSVMGLVGSGATLVSIGAHVFFEHRYKKQIKARQLVINHQVLHILEDLENGTNQELVQPQLASLVGPRATGEFLQLWRAAHP